MEPGEASSHPCLFPILLAYVIAVASVPGSIHSAALSLHVQQLQRQEKDGKLALGLEP